MLYYIIPLIDPNHNSVQNTYNQIFSLLKKTVKSLVSKNKACHVVIVGSKKPTWLVNYTNLFPEQISFILLRSNIFTLMAKIDDGTKIFKNIYHDVDIQFSKNPVNDDIPQAYHRYFNMRGAFHNKDKGLKYFIGIVYCKLLQDQKSDLDLDKHFIALIDGDDFIHSHMIRYLQNLPKDIDLSYVDQGYLLKTNMNQSAHKDRVTLQQVESLYAVNGLSNICGSNRFFRMSSLVKSVYHRLQPVFSNDALYTLLYHRKIHGLFIKQFLNNIKNRPNAWNILPTFLGIHRLEDGRNNMPIHPIQNFFRKKPIPFRSAIKHIHSFNHSQILGDDMDVCVERYREKNMIAFQIKRFINKTLSDFY